MDDRTQRENEVNRGAKAEALLRDELLQEAFDVIDKEVTKAWRESAPSDKPGRDEAYFVLKCLDKFKAHLESVATTGKMAREQITLMDRLRGKN